MMSAGALQQVRLLAGGRPFSILAGPAHGLEVERIKERGRTAAAVMMAVNSATYGQRFDGCHMIYLAPDRED